LPPSFGWMASRCGAGLLGWPLSAAPLILYVAPSAADDMMGKLSQCFPVPSSEPIRDPSLTHVGLSDASDASRNPHKTDDLDAGGRILRPWTRLRALWTAWSVVVRVHSGAWRSPANEAVA
jgi:hypothetical protein